MDRLSALMEHFSLHASAFHLGGFCGISGFTGQEQRGYVHLLRSGRISFREGNGPPTVIDRPSLVLLARPQAHQLVAGEADHAELVCATLNFDGGVDNPLSQALPSHIVLPLDELPTLSGSLEWLFREAFGEDCGRDAILNRLIELMLIQLFRQLMNEGTISTGMMAGLADLRLARAMTLMHDQPARPWSVAELASAASMSRASFAARFHKVVGSTPANYLAGWRVSLAQKRLREGRPIALIADEVGYESPSALARAFRRKVGASPSEWAQRIAAAG